MRRLKNIIIFVLTTVLLSACTPSAKSSQQTPAPSSDNISNTSVEPQASTGSIDSKIVDEINSGRLGIGDLKIGDSVNKALEEIDYLEYEMMYENFYCIPTNDGYILYDENTANHKTIAGYIYGVLEFKSKGIDLGNATIDDVKKVFGKPTDIAEGKWTEFLDGEADYGEHRKELKYKIGKYDLYFDLSEDNNIYRIVYKKSNSSSSTPSAITKRFQISSLKKLLNEQRPIKIFKSPSSNDIVYAVTNNSDNCENVYLWREKDEKPVQIQTPEDDEFWFTPYVLWSPNDKHFILGNGSDMVTSNYIVSTTDCKIKGTLSSYNNLPLWTLDSRKVVFTPYSKIMLKVNIGTGETNDVAVYNLNTQKTTILKKGTADYWFHLNNIKDNVLNCIKDYPSEDPKNIKQEKIKITIK